MKIYFVETADYNILVAEENGKAKILDNDTEIDLSDESAVELLKLHYADIPMNDYSDIYSEHEFDWDPNEFKNVTQVW